MFKPDNNTRCRLVVKAVVWETISNLACFGLAYWIFGNVGGCAVFSVICFAVKLMLYYEHERVWGRISWGEALWILGDYYRP